MVTRIVKLQFHPDKAEEFLQYFEESKHKVNHFEGCKGMKLMASETEPGLFFTYSQWDSEEALENYRNSNTFKGLWSQIKPHFKEKALAWTLADYYNGFNS
jgi:quinol monooxygenase YgiN